ncbi:plasmid pRiA4b ORF-3 family protein [Xylocopilactobacillus apicola]|uniref:Plasmid pRiA4b Orf3-like domain-containing protein n=1 Tax=Xylocopilactobacillus apicola TaxID=2932184 RepID=A0AAU9DVS3_9LACO|nr:plasmid pRiA4b ORF-3 family protein [Xylocopilactobacillus apicola]BDR57993.1 hypothetical protein XA3_04340 [Xylocopilactobacillus apicola]
MVKHHLYQMRAELLGFEPKIWRTFTINGEKTLAQLGYTLIAMFKMKSSHLFEFMQEIEDAKAGKTKLRYTLQEDEYPDLMDDICLDVFTWKLHNCLDEKRDHLLFRYDLGCDWEILVTVEEASYEEMSIRGLPRLKDGAGYGIIEDIGGVGGLAEYYQVYQNGPAEERESYRRWLGELPDLNYFYFAECDIFLSDQIRVSKQAYEEGFL